MLTLTWHTAILIYNNIYKVVIIAHSQMLVLSFLKLLKSHTRYLVKQGKVYLEWGRRNEICATGLESLTPWHMQKALLQGKRHHDRIDKVSSWSEAFNFCGQSPLISNPAWFCAEQHNTDFSDMKKLSKSTYYLSKRVRAKFLWWLSLWMLSLPNTEIN